MLKNGIQPLVALYILKNLVEEVAKLENVPPWVVVLAAGSEFEHHLTRLLHEEYLTEDEVHRLLVVEGAELDVEELELEQIQVLFTEFNAAGNTEELEEKYGENLSNENVAYEQLMYYYDQLFTYYTNKEKLEVSK